MKNSKQPKKLSKHQALNKIEEEYQDIKSPHYRDNERFAWAVKVINRKFLRIQNNYLK